MITSNYCISKGQEQKSPPSVPAPRFLEMVSCCGDIMTLSINGIRYSWFGVNSDFMDKVSYQLDKGFNQGKILALIKEKYGLGFKICEEGKRWWYEKC
jgi:hypothetical protein